MRSGAWTQCCSSPTQRGEGQGEDFCKLGAAERLNKGPEVTEKLVCCLHLSSSAAAPTDGESPQRGIVVNPSTIYDPAAVSALRGGSLHGRPLHNRNVEDRADSQEEAPEDGPQLRDQVKLHHFTQVVVITGGMGLKLERNTHKY